MKTGKRENGNSEKIAECILTLQDLARDSARLAQLSHEERVALLKAAGRLAHPRKDKHAERKYEIRKAKRQRIVTNERKARAKTGIRKARENAVFSAPKQITLQEAWAQNADIQAAEPPEAPQGELKSPCNCYVCKAEYAKLHFFYDSMCPSCAELNYQKRFQTASLEGRVALITGSRLKIGYQAALMMLRAGARVIATTRFPVDSALRYSKEEDFENWKSRLHIYGLDLRHTPSVEIFCSFVEQKYDRLDILINNAAQTVRRPPGFYKHLMANEAKAHFELPVAALSLMDNFEECKERLASFSKEALSAEKGPPVTWTGRAPGIGLRASAALSQIPYAYDHALDTQEVFPGGKLDADLQQVDLRATNSWRLKLGEVPTAEMLELQLVNAIAPFVLCNRLIPMMKKDFTGQKHIVNVSAMEGKFLRFKKSERHPHTNMAKAALNMLTHTAAAELSLHGICMNAVDTGWVTDEDPAALAAFKREHHDFQPPLDIVDGAARVCDPFFNGILTGEHWCGKFLKDYFPIDW